MTPFDLQQQAQDAWLFRGVLDSALAVIVTDGHGIVRRWGAGATALFGWSKEEAEGRPIADLALVTDPVRQRRATDIARRVLAGEQWSGEWTARRRDGTPVAVSTVHQPLRDDEGDVVGFLTTTTDLTARDEFEAALLREAMHDPLTGLPNRTLLLDQLSRSVASPKHGSSAVLFVDLDRFKQVNDAYGHGVGDAVLVEVAERLRSVMREGDVVGRLGGDEFVVLCRFKASAAMVIDIANRISAALMRPFDLKGVRIELSASVGVALAQPGANAEALLDRADAAMYRAKEQGSTDGGVVVLAEGADEPEIWLAR